MAASMGDSKTRKRTYKSANLEVNGHQNGHLSNGINERCLKEDGVNVVYVLFAVVMYYCAIFSFVRSRSFSFPEPQIQGKFSQKDAFYESNARKHMQEFSLHGPRVVGSDANEIHAYQYILKQLQIIKTNALPQKYILIDQQNATGSFDIEFLSDFVSVYRDVKNVAAMLKSELGSEHSLLMSCHFDSSIDSPGAGDNAISCAVMLEILRVFSQSPVKQLHNIIFLFNGAEENLLQASHGFITKHPWADSIKAFVNIDSAGAGGWEIVFQTGPSHPWLVRAYADSAPYPSGSILGQEVFQSGVIPSDTDFRIYRDFGEIPGLDIAYITNGYVYHTQNDQNRYIQPGCVQRGGENLLGLLRRLSSSPRLADPGDERDGTMIYFDLVGYFMVYYPQSVAIVINSALVATIVFRIIRKTFNLIPSDEHDPMFMKNLLKATVALFLTWIAVILTCVAMALTITLLGSNLSWFTHNYNLVPLYLIPSVIVVLYMQDFFKDRWFKANSRWYNEKLFFEATLTGWSILLLLLTLRGMGSAFMPMLYVLGPLVIRDRTMWLARAWNWKNHVTSFVSLHLASLFVPLLVTIYMSHAVFTLFIPIFGRTGTSVNADIAASLLLAILLIPTTGYLVSLCYLCRNIRKICAVLAVVVLVWVCAIVVSPLGFPYSGDKDHPSPNRLLAIHTRRRVFDLQSHVTHEDSGIWLIPFDYNNNKHLLGAMPQLKDAIDVDCRLGPYCGMPFIIPCISMLPPKQSLYLPVPSHTRPDVKCELVKKQYETSSGYQKLDLEITGPDHITVQVRPHPGVTLAGWSLSEFVPEPAAMPADMNETTYFVYYSHGQAPESPWAFSLYLKTDSGYDSLKGLVDIGVAGHYLHGRDKHTPEMEQFLAEAPDWTTPVTWTASWDGYVF
ncbi:endoplasmic reticulum metallopeptidase 1-like isoform X1 [Dreissena polymorpha]|uniref:Peptidase M28 domain-containing protein n=2 Tax=Dreissena polymorpha TaxID=45954 RepID=A0A9D3Y8T0_DREPO|nr:endoplasmic reticulum metallopeptidase 1-like isoform X1 [Dreissena polymorpha]KAH3694079.1 hypothetical protein DPMN_081518 [Dreissena polymorpha]